MARKSAGCKQAGENSAARHSSGHTARTLPRFDKLTAGLEEALPRMPPLVLSLHVLGLVPRVDGRPHSPCRGRAPRRPANALGYFVVVVGFLAVAVAGGVAGFEAITGVSVPPASTERQSAGS